MKRRNINRHQVETDPTMVTLRVDESLYFVNARFLEDLIQKRVTEGCAINHRLRDMGVALHLDGPRRRRRRPSRGGARGLQQPPAGGGASPQEAGCGVGGGSPAGQHVLWRRAA